MLGERKKEVQQSMLIAALLICCSSLRCVSLTPLMCSENLNRPEPQNIGGSRVDLRLPFYTSGFE